MNTHQFPELTPELAEQAMLWIGDQVPGGFFIYLMHGSQDVVYINQAALRIYGCDTMEQFKELTGATFPGMVHPDDITSVQSSIDHQIEMDSSAAMDYVEYRIIRRDGAVRWVDDYGHFAQLPGYGDVFYVFISDVTDKRIAQAARLQMEVELSHERQRSEMKAAFLFNLSHDIRTPMNAIMGFSDLARRHINEPDLLVNYLDKTISSGKQLLALIDDMLEMNSLETGKIHLNEERTDLTQQLNLVIDLFRLEAAQKQLSLCTQINLPAEDVMIDQSRFRRIISNLLSNAIKFTPSGGMVTVTARQRHVSESGFARYEFQVIDNGIGISESFISHIFDAFEREQTSTKTGETGTGLGLSIVRSILNLMGGTITCTSEKGKGSTFTVGIPLRLAAGASAISDTVEDASASSDLQSPASVSAQGHRVLVVEDIELNRDLAETLLEESGFIVECVPDGCDAVEAVRNHPLWYYDVILMDIQMPVMNGYEATRSIRALPREDASLIPIIALSANSREEDKRMSLESGMNCHVSKPFDIDPLVMTINEYITLSGRTARS
ncbi:MAG: response regulator [Clostridia bacterium]|nr:response regulator [Clostridia bacterium]